MAFMDHTDASSTAAIDALRAAAAVPHGEIFSANVPPPTAPGLYAWFQTPAALPGIDADTAGAEAELELLFVGFAPKWKAANGTLGSAMAIDHHGSLGTSSFRRALAALLWETSDWTPRWSGYATLENPDLEAFAEWERMHLFGRWVAFERPWTVEDAVIAEMRPPLNVARNRDHPCRPAVIAARQAFAAQARINSGDP